MSTPLTIEQLLAQKDKSQTAMYRGVWTTNTNGVLEVDDDALLAGIKELERTARMARRYLKQHAEELRVKKVHQRREISLNADMAMAEKRWEDAAKSIHQLESLVSHITVENIRAELSEAIELDLKRSAVCTLSQGNGELVLAIKPIQIAGYKEVSVNLIDKEDNLLVGDLFKGIAVSQEMFPYRVALSVMGGGMMPHVATYVVIDDTHVQQHFQRLAELALSNARIQVEGHRLYLRHIDSVNGYSLTFKLVDKKGRTVLGRRYTSYAFFNLKMDAQPYALTVVMKKDLLPPINIDRMVAYPPISGPMLVAETVTVAM